MKKIVALLMLCVSFMFAAINLQTATKEELMSIKGIGDKKADSIIEYRKTNEIKDPEDLKNIKGFGDSIVSNIKKSDENVKVKVDKKLEKTKEETPIKK
ncbi:MAG: helix-hairpin-helix domain-containing protein [Aliarcobacter sp.]|jgi:competence protein ComEA|nr:helix-hairpin-helix domain-containing protein [Aliarcobacter sp.]